MRNYFIIIVLAMFALAFISVGCAEDSFAGKWKAQFDSQIGHQNYMFEFKVDGTNVTGKAIGERSVGTNTVEITEGKINGDEISFVEPLKLQDNDIRIEYKGKIAGDEIKFHRKVGDFAEYDIVAKRVKDEEKPAAASDANSPPAKP
jgi:hypothetical protein